MMTPRMMRGERHPPIGGDSNREEGENGGDDQPDLPEAGTRMCLHHGERVERRQQSQRHAQNGSYLPCHRLHANLLSCGGIRRLKSMVKRKRNGVADCCDADDVDDSFANVTCMLLMRFICETLADMGTWRPYNGARRSCPGRAGRGAAHGDRRDLQLTVRGVNQGKDSSWQSHPLKRLPKNHASRC